jgi:hypothetical protein
VSQGLPTGRIYSQGGFMLKGFFKPLLCSVVLVGQMQAQEVVVPHETKPEAPRQAAPSSEQAPSESPAPARPKPKPREKKSGSTAPTLEQMRAAGALAAEGRNDKSVPQSTRTSASRSETAAAPSPAVSQTPTPVKKETRAVQTSEPRRSSSRNAKLEAIGPVRPTMIESGREQPSATPSARGATGGEQTPTP